MTCPYCLEAPTKEKQKKTSLGYRQFRCSACHRNFNERDFHSLQLSGIPY